MAGRVSRRAKVGRTIRRAEAGALPDFVPPQLTALTEAAPEGGEWAHELKWDGCRMHARIDGGKVRLLTRTGLDWTDKYPAIADALRAFPVSHAYLDGELCALSEGGLTSFSAMQAATDARSTAGLVLVLFDLLFLDGEDLTVFATAPLKRGGLSFDDVREILTEDFQSQSILILNGGNSARLRNRTGKQTFTNGLFSRPYSIRFTAA
jgi:ATP dependent DNA ligase domain